jgi:hypothetical protein
VGLYVNSNSYVGIGTTTPTYQLQLSQNSAAKPGGGTWTDSSDIRIKEDIQPANLDLLYDIVKSVPLRYYKYKDDYVPETVIEDRHRIGWIADDVEKVFPKAIKIAPLSVCREIEEEIEVPVYEETQEPPIEPDTTEQPLNESAQELSVEPDVTEQPPDESAQEPPIEPDIIEQPPKATVKVLRKVMKEVVLLDDCKYLDETLMIRALYGAVQKLIQKVEKIEEKLN